MSHQTRPKETKMKVRPRKFPDKIAEANSFYPAGTDEVHVEFCEGSTVNMHISELEVLVLKDAWVPMPEAFKQELITKNGMFFWETT